MPLAQKAESVSMVFGSGWDGFHLGRPTEKPWTRSAWDHTDQARIHDLSAFQMRGPLQNSLEHFSKA